MKKGAITNWFRLTLGGELRWYKIKIKDWNTSEDTLSATILEKVFDNTLVDASEIKEHWIDKSEIWTIKKMLEHKKMLFKMMFEVLDK
jgi:hypothetical protein